MMGDGQGPVFMYSGQGSQYYQMGRELFERNEVFRDVMERLDRRVQDRIGQSVVREIYRDDKPRGEPLWPLQISHPAIFMLEYALTEALAAEGMAPGMVLGASMGEWCACVVAGVISLDDALEGLLEQVIESPLYAEPGGMLAVVEDVAMYDVEPMLHARTELAAVNFSKHFVVSGSNAALDDVERWLEKRGVPFQRLPVPFPFHSSLVDAAEAEYKAFLRRTLKMASPALPVLSCLRGEVVQSIEPEYFWDVARQPIRFEEAVRSLGEDGKGRVFVDLGPGGTLATFVKWIFGRKSGVRALATTSAFVTDTRLVDRVREVLSQQAL